MKILLSALMFILASYHILLTGFLPVPLSEYTALFQINLTVFLICCCLLKVLLHVYGMQFYWKNSLAKTFKRNYSSWVYFPMHLKSSDFLGRLVSSVWTLDLFEVSQLGNKILQNWNCNWPVKKVCPLYVSQFFLPLVPSDFDRQVLSLAIRIWNYGKTGSWRKFQNHDVVEFFCSKPEFIVYPVSAQD